MEQGWLLRPRETNQPQVTLHALTMRSKYLPEVASTFFFFGQLRTTAYIKGGKRLRIINTFSTQPLEEFPDQEWQARQRLEVLGGKP